MKEYLKPVLVTVVGVVIALIAYDMFIKGMVGNFESQNYDVDDKGNIMQIAA
jgi:hypothetical protein